MEYYSVCVFREALGTVSMDFHVIVGMMSYYGSYDDASHKPI